MPVSTKVAQPLKLVNTFLLWVFKAGFHAAVRQDLERFRIYMCSEILPL
jgi:hypothetical protein